MTGKTIDNIRLYALDILFPNRCPFCGEFIRWDKLCCDDCAGEMTCANDFICRGCGQTGCVCGKEDKAYDMVYAAFFFDEEPVRNAVYRFKHQGEPNFGEYAAEVIVKRMEEDNAPKPDIIVPVPMGRKKRFRRGHNQAELFGKSLGRRLGIPVRRDILFTCDTKDEQHRHTEKERRERVRELYRGGDADFTGKTVLLCDDVMTTGSTVNRCAEILKGIGAETVIVAACAVTRLTGEPEEQL